MKILIVAGEASGDRHGARLMHAIQARSPQTRFFGVGGEAMAKAGLEVLHDISALSVMGFVEVLPKLAGAVRILGELSRWAERERPDAAILLDAPDFNLRLARELGHLGIPIFYAIAPMVWAWRESRIRALRDLEALLCIYPFEEAWFRERGVPATYVGSPLLDDPILRELPAKERCRERLGLAAVGRMVALLPGSRRAEIRTLFGALLETAQRLSDQFEDLRFVVPAASREAWAEIEGSLKGNRGIPIELVEGRTTEVLRAADAAIVCSGTATLQAALALCPQVMVYRAHPLSMFLARRLVRVPYACIVNLLLGRSLVPEFLQGALQPEALADALAPLLSGGGSRDSMLQGYQSLRDEMMGPSFGERAAAEILARLEPARSASSVVFDAG